MFYLLEHKLKMYKVTVAYFSGIGAEKNNKDGKRDEKDKPQGIQNSVSFIKTDIDEVKIMPPTSKNFEGHWIVSRSVQNLEGHMFWGCLSIHLFVTFFLSARQNGLIM